MSPEREGRLPSSDIKIPTPLDIWRTRLEKAQGTGQLLRVTKGILSIWPGFSEKAATAAYFHTPWISHDGYLLRFDHIEHNHESLRIDRYIDPKTSEAESIHFHYKGKESEEGFEDLTYTRGVEMGGDALFDEESGQHAFIGQSDPPLVGEEALPKAKEIIGDILEKVIKEFRERKKDNQKVSYGRAFSIDPNFITVIPAGPYFHVGLDIDGVREGGIGLTQEFLEDETKLWSITLTLLNLKMEDFTRFQVYILYNGERYRSRETDIDDVQLRDERTSPLHFSKWINESGEELDLDSTVDIFSKLQFLIVDTKGKEDSKA